MIRATVASLEGIDDPTIVDSFYKILDLGCSHSLRLNFVEAGLSHLHSKMDAVVFVFSVTDRDSFDRIAVIRKEMEETRGNEDYAKIILANKSDLSDSRVVSHAEGDELAIRWNCPYYESSAKENVGIDEWVNLLALEIQDYQERVRLNQASAQRSSRCSIL